MKSEKNLHNNFFKLILREINLLVLILILTFSVTIIFTIIQNNKIKETYSKATLIFPATEKFSIAQIAQDNFYVKDNSIFFSVAPVLVFSPETLRERFNVNFTSNLISIKNFQNFLDLEASSNYAQSLKQKKIDIEDYFDENNLEISNSPVDQRRKFVFVFSLKHPLDFDGIDFLKNYIEFTKNNILNDYIKLRLESINSVILLLKNNLEINQKIKLGDKFNNDIRIEFFKLFLDQIYTNNDEINDSREVLFDYLVNLDDISIIKKIEILEFIKKNVSNFEYEPISEISTEEYFEINLILRSILLGTLVSFVIFFSVIFFKQIYKNFLNK